MSSSESPMRLLPRMISLSNSAKLWKVLGRGMLPPKNETWFFRCGERSEKKAEGRGLGARQGAPRPSARTSERSALRAPDRSPGSRTVRSGPHEAGERVKIPLDDHRHLH